MAPADILPSDSSTEKIDSSTEKMINLDFGKMKRKSFLPENMSKSIAKDHKTQVLESSVEDNLFIFMTEKSHDDYEEKPMKKFCTRSKYLGQWNKIGIAGKGIYKYPHGVIYDGYFNNNGEFHGRGILVYPSGQRIEGVWKNGKLGQDNSFITEGGVVMNKNYCVMPDRRFQIELENDFSPAGHEFLTNENPPAKNVPDESYDIVEGFFDRKVKTVYAYPKLTKKNLLGKSSSHIYLDRKTSSHVWNSGYNSTTKIRQVTAKSQSDMTDIGLMKVDETQKEILWIPSNVQEEWIIKHCRKSWDEPVGYRPDIYEEWTKGGIESIYRGDPRRLSTEFDSTHEIIKHLADQINKKRSTTASFIRRNPERDQDDLLTKILTQKLLSVTSMGSQKYEIHNRKKSIH